MLNAETTPAIDVTAAQMLAELTQSLEREGVRLLVSPDPRPGPRRAAACRGARDRCRCAPDRGRSGERGTRRHGRDGSRGQRISAGMIRHRDLARTLRRTPTAMAWLEAATSRRRRPALGPGRRRLDPGALRVALYRGAALQHRRQGAPRRLQSVAGGEQRPVAHQDVADQDSARLAELGTSVERGVELVSFDQDDSGVHYRLRHPDGRIGPARPRRRGPRRGSCCRPGRANRRRPGPSASCRRSPAPRDTARWRDAGSGAGEYARPGLGRPSADDAAMARRRVPAPGRRPSGSRPVLPAGVRPDLLDGRTYVGLVPFRMIGRGAGRRPGRAVGRHVPRDHRAVVLGRRHGPSRIVFLSLTLTGPLWSRVPGWCSKALPWAWMGFGTTATSAGT